MSSMNWSALMKTAGESDMEPLKPTAGHFRVIKATPKKSNAGKDGIQCRFKSLEGETKGKAFNNTFYISPENPNAMWFFFKQMEAFGLTQEGFFSQNPSLDRTCKELTERVVWMKITDDREWNGRKQNDIAEIAAPKNAAYSNPGAALAPTVTDMDEDDDWEETEVTPPAAPEADDPSPEAVGTEEDMTADDEEEKNDDDFSDVPPPPTTPF